MTAGTRAVLIVAALWGALAGFAWYANRANAARDAQHPRLWATSVATGQQYDVFEVRADGHFAGFDLEHDAVRFPDCTVPAEPESPVRCLDSRGKSWDLLH